MEDQEEDQEQEEEEKEDEDDQEDKDEPDQIPEEFVFEAEVRGRACEGGRECLQQMCVCV